MKTKKLIVITLSLVMIGALGMSFSACAKEETPSASTPSTESAAPSSSENKEDNTDGGETPPIVSISFEEFMDNHSDKALSFAETCIKDSIVEDKTPLSQTWGFHANEEDELDSVSLTYTYASSATERVVEVANATLTDPIDLDIIVANEVTSEHTAHQVTRQVAFEFDAKASYLDSDIADALYAVLEDGNSSATKYFNEMESDTDNVRTFKVAVETGSAINVYTLNVIGESDEEIIANLQNDANYEINQTATYPIGDNNSVTFATEKYEQEEFTPENVDEAVNDYSAEITAALDANFLETAGKKCFGRTFDSTKLTNVTWDIGNGETITEIKMIMNYQKSENSILYAIESITLKNPIDVTKLNKDNIEDVFASTVEDATYSQDYIVSYIPQEQGTRNDLINAIFEAYGMTKECPEGAVRYYIDEGYTVDTTLESEARKFKVVEISENNVKEIYIMIKNSANDNEYIEKLIDQTNYRITSEKSYTMDGEKLASGVNASIAQIAEGEIA